MDERLLDVVGGEEEAREPLVDVGPGDVERVVVIPAGGGAVVGVAAGILVAVAVVLEVAGLDEDGGMAVRVGDGVAAVVVDGRLDVEVVLEANHDRLVGDGSDGGTREETFVAPDLGAG